ncbi:MAG: hypothetical protein IKM59_04925 [Oscillospiraceae bacterium]|nr:hypothetical protein [Oscillospiraceae bacterium]
MEYTLQGRLEALIEPDYKSIIIGIDRTDALRMLCYMTALELGRPLSFVIKGQQAIGRFTYGSELQFAVKTDTVHLQFSFSKEQTELMKCCITDNVLLGYYDHIDFSHELCDFTFRIS